MDILDRVLLNERSIRVRRFALVLAGIGLAACMVFAPCPAFAQVSYGFLVGAVRDASGGAVAGAAVRITNIANNSSRQTVSNGSGEYSFPSLESGTYDVTVVKEGFHTSTATGLRVDLDTTTRHDVALAVGAVSESVVVSASAAVLQTESSEVRAEVTSADLADLPIAANQNYESLLMLIPGVSPPEDAHSGAANPGRGLTMSVNGTPRNMRSVRIEGASANNIWLPHVAGYSPGSDAIEVVSVVTGTFDASQGAAGGGAINVRIKSGTNQTHGSLLWNQMNSAFGSRGYFLPEFERKGKYIANAASGTVGGPIRRDKLFYFVSHDVRLVAQNAQALYTVPTPDTRTGDFSVLAKGRIYDPLTGNADGTARTLFPSDIIPASRLSPIALKMQDHVSLPNMRSATGAFLTSSNFFGTGNASTRRQTTDAKIDWRPGSKLSVANRFGWLHYSLYSPVAYGDNGAHISGTQGRPGDIWGNVYSTTSTATYVASPSLVVDGYFSLTMQDTSVNPPGFGKNLGRDELGIPGTNGPTLNYSGWPYFNVSSYSLIGTQPPLFYNDRQFQYGGNVNWTRKRHLVRFGGDLSRQHMDHFETGDQNGPGRFDFTGGPTARNGGSSANQYNNYASFLLGLPTTVQKAVLPFGSLASYQWIYGLYLQDQWRVMRNLTVNLGVRWSRFPLATRDGGRGLERYDFNTNRVELCGVGDADKQCGYRVSNREFGPNIGIAYSAPRSLVVRAGFGLNYDPAPLAHNRDMFTNYPEIMSLSLTGSNSYQPATTLAQGIPAMQAPDVTKRFVTLPVGFAINDTLPSRITRDHVLSWNLTLEKELVRNILVSAGYVASRAVKVPQLVNLNVSQLGAGTAGQPYNKLFGTTATLNMAMPINHTHYDGLQTRLIRRVGSGGMLNLAYTFSKNTGICCNELSDTAPAIQLLQYLPLARAEFPQSRKHQFTAAWSAPSPFGRGKRWLTGGVGSALAGGWRLSTVLAVISGKPFNVTSSTTSINSNGVGTQRADLVKATVATLGGIGNGNPYFDTTAFAQVRDVHIGTAGYEILRGPFMRNLDASLVRDFRLGERFRLQIRADAYNVTNTPQFDVPSGNASSSGFGYITSTIGNQREGMVQRNLRFAVRFNF